MREADEPRPKSIKELAAYVQTLVDGEHDYGTCVYAMSLAATAAFNFVASQLGVTGFQASCADLDILRRTRSLKGPFMLIKAEDALYPQYDLRGNVDKALTKWQPWLSEEATKLLAEHVNSRVSANVHAHWRKLANGRET